MLGFNQRVSTSGFKNLTVTLLCPITIIPSGKPWAQKQPVCPSLGIWIYWRAAILWPAPSPLDIDQLLRKMPSGQELYVPFMKPGSKQEDCSFGLHSLLKSINCQALPLPLGWVESAHLS